MSLRKIVSSDADPLSAVMPIRDYLSTDVQPVSIGSIYTTDVEIWPTNVVLARGDTLSFEVASSDTQGCGTFVHDHPDDRPFERLCGWNHIHLGPQFENFLRLPIIPSRG